MKKTKLDLPQVKEDVIRRLAAGESQTSIAGSIGVDKSQICRFANREDIRAFIEQEQMKLVEAVPDAVENVKGLVREMKKIPKKEVKRRELSYKASVDTLKAVGIMPSPVQSQVMVNIFNRQTLALPPFVQEILEEHIRRIKETAMSEDDEPSE